MSELPGTTRDRFPPEKSALIAKIALAAYSGQSIESLAQHYQLPPESIELWRTQLEERAAELFTDNACGTAVGDKIGMTTHNEFAILKTLSDSTSDVMFAKDRQGRMLFANPATLHLIGKPMHEVLGHTDAEFLVDDEAARIVMENDERIMASGLAEETEEEVPSPDGSPRTWLSHKRPYLDSQGHVVGLLGISRDITERKRQEQAANAANERLNRVLDSITDGLLILDRDWRYTYFSETGARILGLRSEDMIGKCVWDLFPHADELLFGKEYRRAMETGVATHYDEYYPQPLNMWLECHCYPSQDGLSVYFRDISRQRFAQEVANDGERRVNALLEASPVGLAYANAQGHLIIMNAECKRIWGNPPLSAGIDEYAEWRGWWAEGENRGRPLAATDWPMARALSGERVADEIVEIEPFGLDRKRRTILLRSVPIKTEGGVITGAVTAQMDITPAVQARTALEESSAKLRQLANTIPQLAWMADETGAIHWYNDRWYEYTGTTLESMKGWAWQSVHHPDVLPEVMVKWPQALAAGVPFEMTFPLKGKDGLYRPFYTLVEPLRDSNNNVVQWFGTNTDVSTLANTQAELRKTQHWLQEGLVAAKMAAWEWNLETDEVRYSENVRSILGYDPGTVPAGFQLVHDDDRARFARVIEEAISKGASFDEVVRRVRPDNGALIWVQVKGHPVVEGDSAPSALRGIVIDITEQTLRRRELEEESRRKDEFLAMLAHELRNPLAPITTAAQLLTMTPSDAQRVKSTAAVISRQVTHMATLIDDLLDVSRVTRGLIELDKTIISLKEVVNNAIEQASPLIESRKHDLTLHIASTQVFVLGDRIRLTQVIVNLLNNAAKYTAQGGKIVVDVGADDDTVHISVSDNGIGIDAKLLPHVFELFTQAARTSDRAQGGLGLGLALVDSIVKMHGGRVSAFSGGADSGSRFVVTLPLRAAPASVANDHRSAVSLGKAKTLSILVVDDNEDAAQMLSAVLELEGHHVTVCDRPSTALDAAKVGRFDVMVLDIGLPEMDGYRLAELLQKGNGASKPVLVALTGYGQAHDRVLSKAAGFDYHLVKPLDFAELSEILKWVGHAPSGAQGDKCD